MKEMNNVSYPLCFWENNPREMFEKVCLLILLLNVLIKNYLVRVLYAVIKIQNKLKIKVCKVANIFLNYTTGKLR